MRPKAPRHHFDAPHSSPRRPACRAHTPNPRPTSRRGFFHYGPAPAAIAIVAILTGLLLLFSRSTQRQRPDLILVTFAKEHIEGHEKAAAQFYKDTGKRVDIQLTEQKALRTRLQAALGSGAEVPDLVEILEPEMGVYTRGPLSDIGFVDLTDKLKAGNWFDKLVSSRFSLWSSRGHVFALPHDVHPVMLAYRRDLVEQEGIDVSKLTTWDEFFRVGRELVARHIRPDGNSDRYLADIPSTGNNGLFQLMLLQNDVSVLNEKGEVAFDCPNAEQVLRWYVRASTTSGKNSKIGFEAGWGQNQAQTFNEGLILFMACPDWRTKSIMTDMPELSGKFALMPLPAWHPGGRRTSVWGGTGLAIPKRGRDPDLAWQFATYLYYDKTYLPERYKGNNIIPPLKEGWNMPEFDLPDPYYSNQKRGRLFAELAPQTPPRYVNAFTALAETKVQEALVNAINFYRTYGELDKSNNLSLDDYIHAELTRTAEQVRKQMARNVFLSQQNAETAASPATGGAK